MNGKPRLESFENVCQRMRVSLLVCFSASLWFSSRSPKTVEFDEDRATKRTILALCLRCLEKGRQSQSCSSELRVQV